MNKIYSVIWSAAHNAWTVVSELAQHRRGGGQRSRGPVHNLRTLPLCLALALAPGAGAFAASLPAGGEIVLGQGSIGLPDGQRLDIRQHSDKLAIQWQEFNVGEGHRVSFHQPGADSIALNRVLGADGSQIMGQIDANGRVFLINPNGILFGRNAQVDVGSLVASTLDISNEDFASGRYHFRGNGNPGSVQNFGRISAGDGGAVALLGGRVSNQGLVSARRGTVALAAGNAITLDFAGDGLLNVSVDAATRDALVENHQLIQADGGQVLMTAKASAALLQTVVNNTGVIEARTLENRNGRIVLRGGFDGGTVQVAGTLDASAPQGGDGGFIDTSGAHVQVADGARVSTFSTYGKTGEWLIDPTDFTVSAGGGAWTSSGIGAATLSANLANTSVILATVAAGSGAGNIHVDAAVAWNAPTMLTLNAHRDIFIDAPITIAHTGGGLSLNHGNYANTGSVDETSDYHVNAPVSFTAGSGGQFSVNGTEYTLIHTREQLENISVTAPADWDWEQAEWKGNAYALARDLDLFGITYGSVVVASTKDQRVYSDVGLPPPPFEMIGRVVFSGLGHAIDRLTIDGNGGGSYSFGLFGFVENGTLRDFTLANGNVSGYASNYGGTGAVVGAMSETRVKNVTVANTAVQGGSYVGIIAGNGDYSAILDSRVTASSVIGRSYVGGLVGDLYGGYGNSGSNRISISGSYADACVQGDSDVGGLAGRSDGVIRDSYSTGEVEGKYSIGGLVGSNAGAIRNSYATGKVEGESSVGGLAGYNEGTIEDSHATGAVTGSSGSIGGLVGVHFSGSINRSYATGAVTVTADQYDSAAGGLVGTNESDINDSYASGAVSGIDSVGGLVGVNHWGGGRINNSHASGDVEGGMFVGGLVGFHSGVVSDRDTYIKQSSASGSVTGTQSVGGLVGGAGERSLIETSHAAGEVHGQQQVGGLIGSLAASSTVTDSYTSGDIHGTDYVGGLIGSLAAGSTVTDSYASGDIHGTDYVGGLIGQSTGSQAGPNAIEHAYATGNVFGNQYVGGLVGFNGSYSQIHGSFAQGEVHGAESVGGLVGVNRGSSRIGESYAVGNVYGWLYVGGLVGFQDGNSTIQQSYSAGAVSAIPNPDSGMLGGFSGGLLGYGSGDSTVTGSFWNTETSGLAKGIGNDSSQTGVQGLTTAQMQRLDPFIAAGWNIDDAGGTDNAWRLYTGYTAPLLRHFMKPLAVSVDGSTIYDGRTSGSIADYRVDPADGVMRELILGSLQYQISHSNAGHYDTADGSLILYGLYSLQQGYDIRYADSHLAIDKRNIRITADDLGKLYGEADPELTWTLGGLGLAEGDALESVLGGQLTRAAGENVGRYAIYQGSLNLLDSTNYDIAFIEGTLSITPRAITISADDLSKLYGNADPALSWRVTDGSLVQGDSLAGALTRQTGEDVGQYAIGQGSLANGNYAISFIDGVLTIAPRAITITADDLGKFYGEADPALSWRVTGGNLVQGDSFSGLLGRQAGESVGQYAIGQGTLANGNYDISFVDGTLSITPRPINVTANDLTRVYGDADPALTWTVGGMGLANGDSNGNVFSGGLIRDLGEDTGIYGIHQGSLALINGNYQLTGFIDGVFSIVPRGIAISVTADDLGKIYGELDPALTWQVTDGALVGGDTLSGSLIRDAGENVGQYAIRQGTLANPNYNITFIDGVLTITPRAITLRADDLEKIYGNADPMLSWRITDGRLVQGDSLAGALSRQAGENVGQYVIGQGSLADASGNYTISFIDGMLTITPRGITLRADDLEKIYGNADPTLSWRITDGRLVEGDSLSGALARQAGENVGQYAIGQGSLANGNYAISFVDGVFSITPRGITLRADDLEKIYGNADPTLSWRITDGRLVEGDSLSGALARQAGENVGQYAIGQGSLANGTYAISFVDGVFSITPRGITLRADDLEKIYGNADPTLSWRVIDGSLVQGDSLSGALTRRAGENVGQYAIGQGSLADASGNYVISFIDGTLTITPRGITLRADDLEKIYGNADPALSWRITDGRLVEGDSLSGALSRQAGENVGQYAIGQGSLADASGNYTISFIDGVFSITPRGITLRADDLEKIYGNADPTLGWRITDGRLVEGDSLSGALSRQAGENVGQYAIGQGSLAEASGNYTISFIDGTLTITPRGITIRADDLEKIYGNADPTLNWRITDGRLVEGDALSGALSRQAGEDVGDYAIMPGTLGNPNYRVDFIDGTLSVTPRRITITANDLSKVYGDDDPFLSHTIGGMGIASWDSIDSVVFGALQRDAGDNAGRYVIGQGSLTANSNYIIDAFNGGILNIAPRDLVIAADDLEKWYGDADPPFTWNITQGDLASWDSLASVFSGSLSRQYGESVGEYVIHQGNLAGSPNYRIEFQNGRFTIRQIAAPEPQRELTVTADILASPYSPHCQAGEFSGDAGNGCIVPDAIDDSPYRIINGGLRLP
ncbi:MAG: filamentous hemagglutinin N-terminal domain-containing protein [Xanthomonadaceae bacterium]|jgi:filamentous hemagglutinin family protein|nr:filamentous hemagglutinin N-terminal domain-containing protein [Xanthomonadaceae bacterium]